MEFLETVTGRLPLDIMNDIMLVKVIKLHVRNSNANIEALYISVLLSIAII